MDRAVLPIENSLGVRALSPALGAAALALTRRTTQGSIHRNFDLLLRHRLHIVGEVRLRSATQR